MNNAIDDQDLNQCFNSIEVENVFRLSDSDHSNINIHSSVQELNPENIIPQQAPNDNVSYFIFIFIIFYLLEFSY